MYTFDEIIDDLLFENAAGAAFPGVDPKEVIFFDIETTGLSPSRSGLYLIGCMFREGNDTVLRQLFADDFEDERLVLEAFAGLMAGKSRIAHFNGSTFDIPYLKTKYVQHALHDPFEGKESCDIYRKLMPLKKILSLKSMKQKSLEEICGIRREPTTRVECLARNQMRLKTASKEEDIYTGGELINVYKDYQKRILIGRAMGADTESEEVTGMRATLLLHNSDDIKGMMPVAGLLGILSFVAGEFDVGCPMREDGCVSVTIEPHVSVPASLLEGKNPLRFIKRDESGDLTVKVPLIRDTLRLFMKDFRDHYYIPSKDMAVHASVAGFIGSADKKKATPATCYVPCEGAFLTIDEQDLPEGLPLIKRDYTDRTAYVRETDVSEEVLKAAVLYRIRCEF